MSTGWAVSMPHEQAIAAAALRQVADVEACSAGERLWLRGGHWNETLDLSLRKILGAERFHRLAGNETARWGCVVPSGVLPDGPWMPLSEWLQPVAPTSVLSGRMGEQALLQLVRSTVERPANLLCTDFHSWRNYGVSAPQIRLSRLSFAMSDDGRALIRGEPLPPLPGLRYAEDKGVAAPLGWAWSPAVDAEVVRTALGINEHDVALFTSDGSYEVIRADDFVRASRSAVRLTEQEIGGG